MLIALLLLILLTGLDHRFFGGESGLVSFSLAELLAYVLLVVLFLDFCARGATYRSQVVSVLRSSNGFVWLYLAWAFVSAGANLIMAGNRDALHSLNTRTLGSRDDAGPSVLASDLPTGLRRAISDNRRSERLPEGDANRRVTGCSSSGGDVWAPERTRGASRAPIGAVGGLPG